MVISLVQSHTVKAEAKAHYLKKEWTELISVSVVEFLFSFKMIYPNWLLWVKMTFWGIPRSAVQLLYMKSRSHWCMDDDRMSKSSGLPNVLKLVASLFYLHVLWSHTNQTSYEREKENGEEKNCHLDVSAAVFQWRQSLRTSAKENIIMWGGMYR